MRDWWIGLACWSVGTMVALGQASLPTSYSGSWSNEFLPTGWSQTGLSDYLSNYDGVGGNAAKFDDSGDMLTVFVGDVPDKLSYWIETNPYDASYFFKVEESSDGEAWTDVVAFHDGDIPGSAHAMTNSLLPDSRYVRFQYVTRVWGNIGLDGVAISAGPPTNFWVGVDQRAGFNVDPGTVATVKATALNGVAPIHYSWDSTLGAEYWAASGSVFTILATAPTGSYTALVTAMDSGDPVRMASNSVGFVVAPFRASLPTSHSGSWSNAFLPTGWSQTGLMDYPSSYDGPGGAAAQFDAAGDMLSILFAGVPGEVSYWIKSNQATNYVFKVEESGDGETWTDVVVFNGTGISSSTTQVMTNAMRADSRHVRFNYATKDYGNIGLDGVSITAGTPTNFWLAVDPDDGFGVVTGTTQTVTAVAFNGTEPCGYAWDSTLDTAHWSASGTVFTILATAPPGAYSATVVATDASDPVQSASNAVGFFVRTCNGIAITPPVHGAVTTDPAGAAIEGSTVVIHAVADPGYWAASFTVVDAEMNPVAVTENTFTMPASVVTVTVLFETYVAPDAWVDFEDYTGTYASNDYSTHGATWMMTNVYRGNTLDDRKHGAKSGRLENNRGGAGHPAVMRSSAFIQSITKISLWYANYSVNDGGAFKVQVSDDGAAWQDVGPVYDPASTTLVEAVIESIPTNMTYMQIITTAGVSQRVNIDDVGIFFRNPVFRVDLDRTNGFKTVEGSTNTITATAVNGPPPYGFAWSSTLDPAYYVTNGNSFTILSNAPAGTYSAAVVATDALDPVQSASNAVSFVVPLPHDAIVITPPSHGTVTTTPADRANAGETVAITATPSLDCQLVSINVMDSDGGFIVVTSNTFTMPGKGVTLTAFFEEPSPSGSYIVDFEDARKDTYVSATVSLGGKNWDMTSALIGTLVTDWKNGAKSARLRDDTNLPSLTMLEDATNGLGRLSFKYCQYATDPQMDWKAEYSMDGGTNWTQIGPNFIAPPNQTVQLFSETAAVPGNIRVRIVRASNNILEGRHLNLDDIVMTPYGGAEPVSIDGILFEPSSGDFDFALPDGYALNRVLGADMALAGGDLVWSNLTEGMHYSVSNSTITILTVPGSRQLLRIGVNPSP